MIGSMLGLVVEEGDKASEYEQGIAHVGAFVQVVLLPMAC